MSKLFFFFVFFFWGGGLFCFLFVCYFASNRSSRVNPSRDISQRLVPSCKHYEGLAGATSPCD